MSSQAFSSQSFEALFDNFIKHYIAFSDNKNRGLVTVYDKDWPSPCYQSEVENDTEVLWQPCQRVDNTNLANLEEALEVSIPTELHTLFCRYYSHDINAKAEYGSLTLLQAWNEEDFDRLQKNLIAHVLMKRRLKQADTLFFALTDEDDFILSILLETGSVVLERVGKEPSREIAPNLREFFAQIEPLPSFVSL